jgi:hypothetical protein
MHLLASSCGKASAKPEGPYSSSSTHAAAAIGSGGRKLFSPLEIFLAGGRGLIDRVQISIEGYILRLSHQCALARSTPTLVHVALDAE